MEPCNSTSSCALKSFEAGLRVLRENSQSAEGRNLKELISSLEEYIYGHIYIRGRCEIGSVGTDFKDYQLVIHKVPRVHTSSNVKSDGDFCRNHHCMSSNNDADGVFVIRHLGDFSDNILSRGRTWGSRVWLLSSEFADKIFRESSTGLTLSGLEYSFKSSDCLSPRVVLVESDAIACLGSEAAPKMTGQFLTLM